MRVFRGARRAILLTLSLLSACAAADPTASVSRMPQEVGSSGNFLAGRFALSHGDFDMAAADLLRALNANPGDQELLLQTFIACVNAGRPEAIPLARRLPTSQVAQLLLANDAAKSGDWDQAVSRFRAVPRDGADATPRNRCCSPGPARAKATPVRRWPPCGLIWTTRAIARLSRYMPE